MAGQYTDETRVPSLRPFEPSPSWPDVCAVHEPTPGLERGVDSTLAQRIDSQIASPGAIIEALLPDRRALLRQRRLGGFSATDEARLEDIDAEISRWEAVLARAERAAARDILAEIRDVARAALQTRDRER